MEKLKVCCNKYLNEKIIFLDYCKDNLFQKVKEIYEEDDDNLRKLNLLMAREHHKQMTCLHLVSDNKYYNGYI